jgi:hypothetical protein
LPAIQQRINVSHISWPSLNHNRILRAVTTGLGAETFIIDSYAL